jgi:hypothetical protein
MAVKLDVYKCLRRETIIKTNVSCFIQRKDRNLLPRINYMTIFVVLLVVFMSFIR